MNLGIKDRVAIVTASSKGLGRASAEMLAADGCKIVICSRNEEHVNKTVNELKETYHADIIGVPCDLDKPEDIENVYAKTKEQFGKVDILVNNCGGPRAGFFEDFYDDDWFDAYKQVLMSAVRFIRLVLPDMKTQKWGRIVNITSLSVKEPVDNLILSTTFRCGLGGMSKTLSNLLAENKITINTVAPGMILTDRLKGLASINAEKDGVSTDKALENMASTIRMKELGKPQDIGAAVAFLASDLAGYITGNTIHVDGGKIGCIM